MALNNKRTTIVVLIVVPLAMVFALLFYIIDYLKLPEIQYLYPSAEYVDEDKSKYGPTLQVSTYYWTNADLSEVQEHYENYVPPFIASGVEYGVWFISGYNRETQFDTDISSAGHSTVCSDQYDRQCTSVVLLDLSQKDVYRTGVASPDFFRNLTPPPYLQRLPQSGTLIIYSFWQINLN